MVRKILPYLPGFILFSLITQLDLGAFCSENTAFGFQGAVFVGLLGGIGLFVWGNMLAEHERKYEYLIQLFGFCYSFAWLWMLRDTDYGLFGIHADAWYVTSLVTRFSDSWNSQDFTYKDLSSFYPFLYPYILGKVGALLNVPGWKMVKIGMAWMTYFLPILSFFAWRKVFEKSAPAFLLVLLLCTFHFDVNKPYEDFVSFLILPWYYWFFHSLTLAKEDLWGIKNGGWKSMLLAGLLGAILFTSYYYHFFLLVLFALVYWGSELLKDKKWNDLAPSIVRHLQIVGVMLIFSSFYWLPLVMDLLSLPSYSMQNRWFQAHYLDNPTSLFKEIRINSLLAIVGIVFLLANARGDKLIRFFSLLLLSLFLFNVTGHLAIMMDTPLLHHKMNKLMFLIGYAGVALLLERSVEKKWLDKQQFNRVVLALGSFLLFYSTQQIVDARSTKAIEWANGEQPTPVISNKAFVAETTNKVLLTSEKNLTAYAPIFQFIGHNAHYSHPSSQYRNRIRLLKALEASEDIEFVLYMLRHNRFDQVEYLYFPGKAKFEVADANFPNSPPYNKVQVDFSKLDFKDSDRIQPVKGVSKLLQLKDISINGYKAFSADQLAIAYLFGTSALREAIEAHNPRISKSIEEFPIDLNLPTQNYTDWATLFSAYTAQNIGAVQKNASSGFSIYFGEKSILYQSASLDESKLKSKFLLHYTPVNQADLPLLNGSKTKFIQDFYWKQKKELVVGNHRWFIVPMPAFPVKHILTGQFHKEGSSYVQEWKTEWGTL